MVPRNRWHFCVVLELVLDLVVLACVLREFARYALGVVRCPIADRTRVYSEHTAYRRWRPAVTLLLIFFVRATCV